MTGWRPNPLTPEQAARRANGLPVIASDARDDRARIACERLLSEYRAALDALDVEREEKAQALAETYREKTFAVLRREYPEHNTKEQ